MEKRRVKFLLLGKNHSLFKTALALKATRDQLLVVRCILEQ